MNDKECKYSKYNIYYCDSNNNNYVYNIANRMLVMLGKIKYKNISKIERKHLNFLVENKYIVPNNVDESLVYMDQYRSQTDNTNLHLVIMASTGCNFDCKYCYFDYEHLNFTRESSDAILKFVKNIIGNYKGIRVDWFGGEPLLAKEEVIYLSKELKHIAKMNKIPIVGTITTNGYNLDIETFNKLVSSNIINFQITVDGIKSMHDYYRPLKNGQGTYDTIVNNLDDINEKGEGYYFVNVRNNITTSNYNACKEFGTIFYKKFGDNKKFRLTRYPVKNWGGNKINKIKDQLVGEKSYLEIINTSLNSNLLDALDSMRCFASKRNAFVITPDCKIRKCSHIGNSAIELDNNIGEINMDGSSNLNHELISEWCNIIISKECMLCKYLPECINNHCPMYSMYPSKNCSAALEQVFMENIQKEIYNEEYIKLV